MRAFDYASATVLDEALALLGRDGGVRPLAGGTDLLPLMKADVFAPEQLLDIKRLPGLRGIAREPDGGLRIGGLTTLSEIEENPLVRQRYAVLVEAIGEAATPQLRNMATLGGNLLQRPRCWYYRSSHFHCWLKGGDDCPMREGENRFATLFDESPCVAVHPSDVAPALLALDAEVEVRGSRGERTLPVSELLQPPTEERRTETTLAPDELITAVRIAPLPAGARSSYLKAMDRKAWAFALVSVATVLQVQNNRIAHARLVLGGVANVPHRAISAERLLLGAAPSDDLFRRAADAALAGAHPLSANRYKLPLAKTLVRRGLAAVAG